MNGENIHYHYGSIHVRSPKTKPHVTGQTNFFGQKKRFGYLLPETTSKIKLEVGHLTKLRKN